MYFTILLIVVDIVILIYAYLPELAFYYRINVLSASDPIPAHMSRLITKMAERYLNSKYYILCGKLIERKKFFLAIGFLVWTLNMGQLLLSCPVELPVLLSIVISTFIWVVAAWFILKACLVRYKKTLFFSFLMAVTLPPCLYGLTYLLFISSVSKSNLLKSIIASFDVTPVC